MPSPRRRRPSHSVRYFDDSSDDECDRPGNRGPSRPRGYGHDTRPSFPQRDSLVKREKDSEKDSGEDDGADSQWDTDYDPRDKYYLSAEDGPLEREAEKASGSPTRSKVEKPTNRDTGVPESHSSRPRGHDEPQRRSHPLAHSRDDHSSPLPHSRDNRQDSPQRNEQSRTRLNRPNRPSTIRPRIVRASSYLKPRPRLAQAHSHTRSSRPRGPHRLPPTSASRRPQSAKAGPQPLKEFPWQDAARLALQAGTVAAIKVGTNPTSWTVKGTQIASAALGAVAVDHLVKPKKKGGIKYVAMRHMAELALGNLIVGPTVGNIAGGKSHAGGRRR